MKRTDKEKKDILLSYVTGHLYSDIRKKFKICERDINGIAEQQRDSFYYIDKASLIHFWATTRMMARMELTENLIIDSEQERMYDRALGRQALLIENIDPEEIKRELKRAGYSDILSKQDERFYEAVRGKENNSRGLVCSK